MDIQKSLELRRRRFHPRAAAVQVLTFNERSPVLAVRPYCNTAQYWQVYFDGNCTIRDTFGAAGYPAAEAHHHVRRHAA